MKQDENGGCSRSLLRVAVGLCLVALTASIAFASEYEPARSQRKTRSIDVATLRMQCESGQFGYGHWLIRGTSCKCHYARTGEYSNFGYEPRLICN